jgi:hypothetical protein
VGTKAEIVTIQFFIKPQGGCNWGDNQGINCNSAVAMKKENSNAKYFPDINECLFEARGRRAITNNRYRNACRKIRAIRREDNCQVIWIGNNNPKILSLS